MRFVLPQRSVNRRAVNRDADDLKRAKNADLAVVLQFALLNRAALGLLF